MSENPEKTRFALVRHAVTKWNVSKRIQGQKDSPLSVEGANQAKAWGRILNGIKWGRIICSDIGRAKKTADYINIALNLDIILDARLREQDWGVWTGKTLAQIKEENPRIFSEQMDLSWRFQPPGGEDRVAVLKRGLDSLKDAREKWPGENILVITHEGVIKCLLSYLRETPSVKQYDVSFLSDHLHWISYTTDGPYLEEINAILLP